jgi:hypothetical protein
MMLVSFCDDGRPGRGPARRSTRSLGLWQADTYRPVASPIALQGPGSSERNAGLHAQFAQHGRDRQKPVNDDCSSLAPANAVIQ